MALDLTAGWTGPVDFILKADGTRVIFTTSGDTPTLILKTRDGVTVNTSGDVAWLTASCGVLQWLPDAGDLVASRSPYAMRVRVTDSLGRVIFFPNSAAEAVTVHPE